jgi:hypothetical protein
MWGTYGMSLTKKNHYFLQNCCFEKDGGDCCAKILKPLKKNKEERTMNCFLKMGSLAKIIDLTTWPHNNHIFPNNICTCGLQNIMIDGLVGRIPLFRGWRIDHEFSSTLEINITFIMMRLGRDHSLLCSCRMWAYYYAKFKFSWHTYAKMCRQNMPKWQNVFTNFMVGWMLGVVFSSSESYI